MQNTCNNQRQRLRMRIPGCTSVVLPVYGSLPSRIRTAAPLRDTRPAYFDISSSANLISLSRSPSPLLPILHHFPGHCSVSEICHPQSNSISLPYFPIFSTGFRHPFVRPVTRSHCHPTASAPKHLVWFLRSSHPCQTKKGHICGCTPYVKATRFEGTFCIVSCISLMDRRTLSQQIQALHPVSIYLMTHLTLEQDQSSRRKTEPLNLFWVVQLCFLRTTRSWASTRENQSTRKCRLPYVFPTANSI